MNKLICSLILLLLVNTIYSQDESHKIDLSIELAIEIALKNNPEIKKAKRNVDAAKGRFWSNVSLPQPTISASYEFIPLKKNIEQYEERTFEISQSFDFPTNYFLRAKQSSATINSIEAESDVVILNIIAEVKKAYYRTLARMLQLNIASENLEIAREFARKAEIKFNVGEATNLEKLTARVQLTEAENSLETTKNELVTAERELKYTLGSDKGNRNVFVLTDSLKYYDKSLSEEELFTSAINNNPIIRQAEQQLRSSTFRKRLAWSSFLPSFNVAYFRQALGDDKNYYGVSFGVSLPLWFMFDQRGQIQEATAEYRWMESELIAVRNLLSLNVKNAYLNFKNEERQLQLYKNDLLPQAEEIYRAASLSYEVGEITYLEYLQAKQTLISVRNNYISALLNYNTALISLEQSVGIDSNIQLLGELKNED